MQFGNTLKKFGIKACSAILLVLMLSLVIIIPASGVDSAGEVKFVDMSTPDSSLAAIVEGNSIDLEVVLNGDFQPHDDAFTIVEGGTPVLPDIILDQPGGSSGRYEMTAGHGSATGGQASTFTPTSDATSAVYTINPQIIAFLTEGNVTETAGGTVYSNTVESANQLGITVSSSLQLTVTVGETDEDIPTFNITAATGYFEPYKDSTVALKSIDGRTLAIQIIATGRQTLDFTFNTSQRLVEDDDGNVTGIIAGSTFDINFSPPVINGVVLTVVSPQQVVNEVAASILNNPTSPSATDTSGLPFIDLKGEDTLSHISEESFSLLKAVEKYNVSSDNLDTAIRIDWEWQPVTVDDTGIETPAAAGDPLFDVVNISDGRGNSLNANIVPKVDDVIGYLEYTVEYNIPERYYPSDYTGSKVDMVTSTGQIRVTIRGTGVPPEIGSIVTRQGKTNDSGYDEVAHLEIPGQYDVFQGDRPLYSKPPIHPYYVSAVVQFGAKNSAADYAIIEASSTTGTPNAFEININGAGLPYNLGDKIENPSPDGEGTFLISFTAKQAGSATYTIKFYQDNELMSTQITTGRLNALDTTPSDDSSFLSFEVTSDQLTGDFEGFPLVVTPVANTEVVLTVPHRVEAVKFKALVNDINADSSIAMDLYVGGTIVPPGSADPNPPYPGTDSLQHGTWSNPINILDATEDEYVFYFTITAEDKSSTVYPVRVIRERASTDATLKTLSAYESDLETAENLLPDFAPDVFEYNISVPYRRDRIFLNYEKNWPGATLAVSPTPSIIAGLFSNREVIDLKYDDSVSPLDNVTTIKFEVTAEDGTKKTYTLNVTRLAPSTDASVSDFFFTDQAGEKIAFDDGQQFVAADTKYYITIPYSTESLKLNITPNDEFASEVNVSVPLLTGSNDLIHEDIEEGEELPIIDIGRFEVADVGEEPISLSVYVTAEDKNFKTNPPYEVVVNRLPPNTNTNLSSMDVTDINNTTIPSFIFNQALTSYDDLNVDYLVETVIVSPVAASELSTVTIDGVELNEYKKSVSIDLEPVTPKTVVVKVTAESGDVQDYLLHLYRLPPDSDARLASLDVQGIEKLTPNFIPSTTAYSGMMTDDINEITITAKPVSEYATMRINGDGANSGEATSPISMLYENQTVEIVVTAQDGTTKMTYTIDISNPNLLPTSDDATLQFLDVQSGVMEPEFIPNLDTYKASVLPDVSYVNVIPVPSDPRATMEVKQGSKLLDEMDGGYVSSLQDGENEFTVNVTSSDETKTMEYKVSVYRNDEENAGSLRPITAEDINFEGESPIVVDIRSYPVVSSDVFEAMEEYSDKSIIFQGHDYSFTFNGADLTKNLPYAEYYDFSVSFSPPEENEINALMASLGNVSDPGYPVYIYFSQHTTLPATATFTLSLGTAYGDRNLFWHYYNTEGESERIDYYGYFPTNSRGTFTVPMDHFSTYIVYNRVIAGSENKADRFGTDALSTAAGDKVNPNTKEME